MWGPGCGLGFLELLVGTSAFRPRHGVEGKGAPPEGGYPEERRAEGRDSVGVEIPFTQREYEGEGYRAWVSGYEPRLDSIFVFARRDVVTIREPSDRPRRWGIGVFAGYGVTPRGLGPCVGVSINYNLWNF